MNIFFLDSDLELNAQYYCDKHVVKMLVEYAQLLSTCNRVNGLNEGYAISHKNNPCSVWVRESLTNWRYLRWMAYYVNEEFKFRYGHGHKSWDVIESLSEPRIPDLGFTVPPLSMPNYCKTPHLIESYRLYYAFEKYSIVSWKFREVPFWYSEMRDLICKKEGKMKRVKILKNELEKEGTSVKTEDNTWEQFMNTEMSKDYFIELLEFLINEYDNKIILPKKEDIFKCTELTPYSKVKCVILGQDPYANSEYASGLAFSCLNTNKVPPSLKNILSELKNDLKIDVSKIGDLSSWAKEGVLLLNSVLTVELGNSGSHKGKGWEIFTDNMIRFVNEKKTPVVFILWGAYAMSKYNLITSPQHTVLQASHPSPHSAHKGFFGSEPFSKTNRFLVENGQEPIDWYLEKEGE